MRNRELTAILWDIQAQLELQVRLVDRARLELTDSRRSDSSHSEATETQGRLIESLSALSDVHHVVQGLLSEATSLAAAPRHGAEGTQDVGPSSTRPAD